MIHCSWPGKRVWKFYIYLSPRKQEKRINKTMVYLSHVHQKFSCLVHAYSYSAKGYLGFNIPLFGEIQMVKRMP